MNIAQKENETEPAKAMNPWISMFFRPRQTLRWLVLHENEKSARWLWLSFTALLIISLFAMATFAPGVTDRAETRMQLVYATPLIFTLSWICYVFDSFLLHFVCGKLGGRSQIAAMRIVNAYTTVIPGIIFGVFNYAVLSLFGQDKLPSMLLEYVIVVWTVYISACGVSAAAEITVRKGLLVYMLALLLWLIPSALAFLLMQLLRTV